MGGGDSVANFQLQIAVSRLMFLFVQIREGADHWTRHKACHIRFISFPEFELLVEVE